MTHKNSDAMRDFKEHEQWSQQLHIWRIHYNFYHTIMALSWSKTIFVCVYVSIVFFLSFMFWISPFFSFANIKKYIYMNSQYFFMQNSWKLKIWMKKKNWTPLFKAILKYKLAIFLWKGMKFTTYNVYCFAIKSIKSFRKCISSCHFEPIFEIWKRQHDDHQVRNVFNKM